MILHNLLGYVGEWSGHGLLIWFVIIVVQMCSLWTRFLDYIYKQLLLSTF